MTSRSGHTGRPGARQLTRSCRVGMGGQGAAHAVLGQVPPCSNGSGFIIACDDQGCIMQC